GLAHHFVGKTMTEIISLVLFIFLGVSFLLYLRLKDSRYLKKTTREALREGLREEIEQERNESSARRGKFEKALKKAEGKE
ncbi:MAG: hypothetical protein Q7S00_04150, partial [bacterium]|nr:hypothetical protein [bacterium]